MSLTDFRVLVTRPAHQAEALCEQIEALGGIAIRLPVLEIIPLADRSPLSSCRQQLPQLDMLIFVSANAVEYGLPELLDEQKKLPVHLTTIAIGKKTAEALQAWGVSALCAPAPYNTEALLIMPLMQQVEARKIIIVRGEGGRETLAEQLRLRGAQVDYLNVYRRECPRLLTLPTSPPDIMIVTSSEGLQNLLILLAEQSWVKSTPLLVMSERTRNEAINLGFSAPILVTKIASDEGLLNMLVYWKTKGRFTQGKSPTEAR
ncbi:uroporphyrinogen-III synthase [Beggiatoa alba B18LD]|uniref:Uroporphyrinogen-III synthase n=1 Tax=Beggiatoa alba B18LD TaxID=395493 RepID=I3CKA4_9GAMM|nr:uroporphyrinogen-III synthase [Beggiatoa alba]EIJ44047.1 uroporphyrinogen-III synthase [Beggiatoa alba B18LD]